MKTALNLDKKQVADYYRQMLLIRRFEEASGRLYMQGKIRGFLHLYIGQEAIAAGAVTSLDEDDYVISHYRDHGHALARGLDPKAILAELSGKATGTSGGKGGSMHLFDTSRNFMGGYAIVRGTAPHRGGPRPGDKVQEAEPRGHVFLRRRRRQRGRVPRVHEPGVPVEAPGPVFLENNLYGMGSHVDQTHAGGQDIYLTAESYRIPAAQVDGMDLVAVRDATIEAIKRVRSGSGPVFFGGDDLPVPRPLHGRPLRVSRGHRGE